jgi:DNA-binding NarL/FixJ family response regulator
MSTTPHIVLIDDNLAWLEALAEFLRRRGLATETARDAEEGLALLERRPPAVVVVDLHMPGMDGLEFLRQLRRNRRDVAVLVVSSDDEPDTVARALAAGARGFVPKNTPPSLLWRAVQRTLDAALAGPADPPAPAAVPSLYLLLPFHRPYALLPFLPS